MKMRAPFLCCVLASLALASCGYHVGGLKNSRMQNVNTFCINMFENDTTFPQVSQQMTTALADALQRDGSFRLASSGRSDCSISGKVTRVSMESLRTDPDDTYLSSEVGLTVYVDYKVTDLKTGKVILEGSVSEQGSYFNNLGNMQSARDASLSYATRRAASSIVDNLTLP